MIRAKTLSLPLVSALLASAVVPAEADVAMSLSSHKTYRQNSKGKTDFRGGSFEIGLRDGNTVRVGGCEWPYYVPANLLRVCSGGSTGFILFGDPDDSFGGPYFWFTEVIPALIIEPRRPELCVLKAAPASKLERPSSGFADSSYGLYYNLHQPDAIESIITRYDYSRTYKASQRTKFEDEIVPGVYHYSFPRLHNPVLRVPISPVIYPLPEGYAELNNQKTGVQIESTGRWTKSGFMELSYIKPNIIKWKGFSPSSTFPTVDDLHFSMRFLSNEKNPLSDITYVNPDTGESPASFFPTYVNGGDPKILLANPFVDSFTLPPIFKGGSKAVIELELDRGFQTGGITYDLSSRKFQVPVIVVNRYTEYAELRFGSTNKSKTGILDDYDNDGYNNLNEWILDSRGDDSASIPAAPIAQANNVTSYATTFLPPYPYFGFTVEKKRGTVPKVKYTLQRSTNNGKSWKEFVSDGNWIVTETTDEIRVQSRFDDPFYPYTPVQPPGTAGDKYRVKITLRK